jgi:hypothetical protein
MRKGEVFNWLNRNAGAVGMVDEDPDSPPPRDLGSYQEVQAADGLRLYVRRGSSAKGLS